MNYFNAPHIGVQGKLFPIENIYLDEILLRNLKYNPSKEQKYINYFFRRFYTCCSCNNVFKGEREFGRHIVICDSDNNDVDIV